MSRYLSVGFDVPGFLFPCRVVLGEKYSAPLANPRSNGAIRLGRWGKLYEPRNFCAGSFHICHLTNVFWGKSGGIEWGSGEKVSRIRKLEASLIKYSIELGMLGRKFPVIPTKGLRSVMLQTVIWDLLQCEVIEGGILTKSRLGRTGLHFLTPT